MSTTKNTGTPQGGAARCYDHGLKNPHQKKPPITAGVPGSASWKAFRKGQRDARRALPTPEKAP